MQLLAPAAFPMGWCRMNLASPSHVWKLWELQELGFGACGSFRCEAEAWICDCSGGSEPFGNEKPAPNDVGENNRKKKDSIWKFWDIWWVNLLSKPFDPLFTYSAANPEKHQSPYLIWIKQLILLGLEYRCEALIQPSRKVMGWPEPHSPNYPKTHQIQALWRDKKHNPSIWPLFMELCSVTPVYSASVK